MRAVELILPGLTVDVAGLSGTGVTQIEAAILCLSLAVAALAVGYDENGDETCPAENATDLGWPPALRKH
jgi:hypothetical protein